MKTALAGRGIRLGPSLWALTGGSPRQDADDTTQVPQQWTRKRSLRARREPMPGQLALF